MTTKWHSSSSPGILFLLSIIGKELPFRMLKCRTFEFKLLSPCSESSVLHRPHAIHECHSVFVVHIHYYSFSASPSRSPSVHRISEFTSWVFFPFMKLIQYPLLWTHFTFHFLVSFRPLYSQVSLKIEVCFAVS